jgi:pimeloyl-ACP methyl ester carboxylesterase
LIQDREAPPAQLPIRSSAEVNGIALSVQRLGSGQQMVFLHGASGVPSWLPFFDLIAGDGLIVPDHPGFGYSPDAEWIRNVSDVAMFYLDVFEELDLRNVHVVGHSLGGWIAAEMAVRDRSRFRSLTLIAPAGIRIKGIPCGDNFIWNPEETARNLFFDQRFSEAMLARVPTDEEADILLQNRFTAAKLGWQPRWFNPDLEKWLHRAKLPTQLIWGDHDKLMPYAYAALWRDLLPQARLATIERCGHLPHVERAEEVAAIITRFTETVA